MELGVWARVGVGVRMGWRGNWLGKWKTMINVNEIMSFRSAIETRHPIQSDIKNLELEETKLYR